MSRVCVCSSSIVTLYPHRVLKVDMMTIEEVDGFARLPNSIVVSVRLKLNLDMLLETMWQYMGIIRVYTKKKGRLPDLNDPLILTTHRRGVSIEAALSQISKEMHEIFHYSLVWGRYV